MTMESHNAKLRGPQHGTYLTGRNDVAYSNIHHADRLNYQRAKQGCDDLRSAMMRYYYKRNGVRL